MALYFHQKPTACTAKQLSLKVVFYHAKSVGKHVGKFRFAISISRCKPWGSCGTVTRPEHQFIFVRCVIAEKYTITVAYSLRDHPVQYVYMSNML